MEVRNEMKTNIQNTASRAELSRDSTSQTTVPQSFEMEDPPSTARGILMGAAFHEPPCTTIPELRLLLEGLSEAVARIALSDRGIRIPSRKGHQFTRALFVQTVDERDWTGLNFARCVSNRSSFATTETLVLPSKGLLAELDDSAPDDPIRTSVYHSYHPLESFESSDIRVLFPFIAGRTAVADRLVADHYSRTVQGALALILSVK